MDLPKLNKEDLEGKSLRELLNSYAIYGGATHTEEPNRGVNCETIHDFILQNFTEKPTVELRKAYDAVDAMNLSEKVKQGIKQAKYCAFDIAQHLDPMNVSGMAMLKKIIEERISVAEKILEGFKEPSD